MSALLSHAKKCLVDLKGTRRKLLDKTKEDKRKARSGPDGAQQIKRPVNEVIAPIWEHAAETVVKVEALLLEKFHELDSGKMEDFR